jgi:hypothetical protein
MFGADRPRNWILKTALVVLGGALAALGVFGWADKAHMFEALSEPHASIWAFLASLHPLWPLFGAGALGSIAAQFLAASAAVNFARLAAAHPIWRGLCAGFFAVGAGFAAYSADLGAGVIIGLPHRAAFEAREADRAEFAAQRDEAQRQVAELDGRILLLSDAARLQGWPGERLERQAAPLQALRDDAAREARAAQEEFNERPAIPRERDPAPWEGLVLIIFLAWASLEPWGYTLADRGRVEMPGRAKGAADIGPDTQAPGADTVPDMAPASASRAPRIDPALGEQHAYLRTVNERYARVWRMRKIERRSYSAIAAALNIKIPAVQRALRGALKALEARRAETLEQQGVAVIHREKAIA